MKRRETGDKGERIAAEYLSAHGYHILECNFRTREGEIDIVAESDGTLVFVEVRTKTSRNFGTPEESITVRKKARLIALAEAYIDGHDDAPASWRIDVVAIELGPGGKPARLEHIENATDWGMA
ncbi:MAG: YraN family protein [Chloroflexota bacterium]|nr:YraN family protein [Chloroflexota bacterium]